jgi:predicted P-loop ATPase
MDQLKHDGPIVISTGNSRKEKKWTNKELTWSEFLEKVKTTQKTTETAEEYRKMSKDEQDDRKDVGGFVGGKLKGGRRKNGFVEHRSLLTLDMDYAQPDVWVGIFMLYDYACCIYSTHKHVPEAPRLRLVIPLARVVSAEEYTAIARKVAYDLGIEQFDDTTYSASRLMYWPSTSSDVDYVFEHIDGPWLDPDEVLGSYEDWKDASSWPVSSRQQSVIKKSAEKQADPTTKDGVIGAFCRAYSITEVLGTFLSDVYVPCDIEGRYTFLGGSTSGGLIIYDNDLFAFSHHGTDPISGKLVNAFDLVRVHKFGAQDDGVEENTPPSKRPSYKAMQEFAVNDVKVKKQLMSESMAAALEDFGTGDDNWTERLDYKKDGTLKATIDNSRLIMGHDPQICGTVGHNEFAHRNELLKDLPWRSMEKGFYWSDADDAALRHYLERVYGLNHVGKTMDAFSVIVEQNRYNPIKDYLSGLVWDGIERLDTLLIDYFSSTDTEYTRAVTRKTMCAAVARIFNPGCKFDYMLLLIGKQGLGKSYFMKKLGGKWYSDSLTTVVGKEAYEQLQGAWILEMGELSAAKKADIDALKHFISKQEDIFREAYGRRTAVFPRQCIFMGTTNDYECLRDKTGGRRFWPVNVGEGKHSLWDDFNVDQVWAEAVQGYKAGEELYLKDMLAEWAMHVQAEHTEESDRSGLVYEYLDVLLPDNWETMDLYARRMFLSGDFGSGTGTIQRSRVCAMEIWCECFGGDPKQLSNIQSREIRSILDHADGWRRHEGSLRFSIYGRQRGFLRS